jgi:hypothetical protein
MPVIPSRIILSIMTGLRRFQTTRYWAGTSPRRSLSSDSLIPPPLRSVGTNPGERPGGSKYPCSLPTVPLREKSEALRRGYA